MLFKKSAPNAVSGHEQSAGIMSKSFENTAWLYDSCHKKQTELVFMVVLESLLAIGLAYVAIRAMGFFGKYGSQIGSSSLSTGTIGVAVVGFLVTVWFLLRSARQVMHMKREIERLDNEVEPDPLTF